MDDSTVISEDPWWCSPSVLYACSTQGFSNSGGIPIQRINARRFCSFRRCKALSNMYRATIFGVKHLCRRVVRQKDRQFEKVEVSASWWPVTLNASLCGARSLRSFSLSCSRLGTGLRYNWQVALVPRFRFRFRFLVMARNIRTLLGRRFNQIRREEEVYATMKATVDCKGKCGKDGWEGKKKAKGRGPNAMMDFGRARYDKAEAVLGWVRVHCAKLKLLCREWAIYESWNMTER